MRALLIFAAVVLSFFLGIGVQRHLNGDELRDLWNTVLLMEAQVETLQIRCKALEREAAELRMRSQAFLPNAEHL